MMSKAALACVLGCLPTLTAADACSNINAFALHGISKAAHGVEAQCTMSRVLGAGRSEDCFWRYPLRSGKAQHHFDSLLEDLRNCADGRLNVEATGVNHPDSFDQVTAQVAGIAVSLSLKDKGGLSETLVVLRRQIP